MKIHLMEQKSEAWFKIREKKMTGSHADTIGVNGAGLKTYILDLMSQYYSGVREEGYSNKDMERGNELEPQARSMYEMATGLKSGEVKEIGFAERDKSVGVSPDGLLPDRVVEIKSPNNVNYFKLLINGEKAILSKYLWQINMEMLICEKKKGDLVFYNPNFSKNLIIFQIDIDKEKVEKLEEGFKIGKKLIKEIQRKWEISV